MPTMEFQYEVTTETIAKALRDKMPMTVRVGEADIPVKEITVGSNNMLGVKFDVGDPKELVANTGFEIKLDVVLHVKTP